MNPLPEVIENEKQLEELLAAPDAALVECMKRMPGNLAILGVAGKMGPSLARLAVNACRQAGNKMTIYGVSRFSDQRTREELERDGVKTLSCDFTDPAAVNALPDASNVIYMAGRKFGSLGSEALTWMMNTVAPGNVARRYAGSRIVVFSTGCVYGVEPPEGGGSRESDPAAPIGEYAASCLGRERIFEYGSRTHQTPVLLFRLNYAVDLRYGVLVDVARCVWEGQPVSLNVNAANVIWQGDANARALLCLERAASPPEILNVTGPEQICIRDVAIEFGRRFQKPVTFCGTDSGKAYLSNAQKSVEWFGPPSVSIERLIQWAAEWIRRGGRTLDKPTHFSTTNGQFLSEANGEAQSRPPQSNPPTPGS